MIPAVTMRDVFFRGRRLTFVFTVRREGRAWLVRISHCAMLGLSPIKDAALQCARRAAILMSESGVRVIVMPGEFQGEFDAVFVSRTFVAGGAAVNSVDDCRLSRINRSRRRPIRIYEPPHRSETVRFAPPMAVMPRQAVYSLFQSRFYKVTSVGTIKELGMGIWTGAGKIYTSPASFSPVRRSPSIIWSEKSALLELSQRMLEHPEDVLPRFVELAMTMTGGVSAGLSLYEPSPRPEYSAGGISKACSRRSRTPPRPAITAPAASRWTRTDRFSPIIPNVSIAGFPMPASWCRGAPGAAQAGWHGSLGYALDCGGQMRPFRFRPCPHRRRTGRLCRLRVKMIESKSLLQKALEEQETLAKEMSHRVKNLFAVAEGMVRMAVRTAETKEEMAKTLIGRFHALASAHGLIRRSFGTEQDRQRLTDVAALLEMIVAPHERTGRGGVSRFHIEGPQVACGEHAVNGIALVFHELATNAAKYGALLPTAGEVDVRWEVEGEDLVFHWVKEAVPAIATTPEISGFGSKAVAGHDPPPVRRSLRARLATRRSQRHRALAGEKSCELEAGTGPRLQSRAPSSACCAMAMAGVQKLAAKGRGSKSHPIRARGESSFSARAAAPARGNTVFFFLGQAQRLKTRVLASLAADSVAICCLTSAVRCSPGREMTVGVAARRLCESAELRWRPP